MKHCISYTCTAALAVGTLVASLVLAEDKPASPKLDPKMEAMMKKAEAAGKPGPAHKALEPLVGDWTGEVKCWLAPDAPPTVTKATAKTTWVMNGRFVQEEFHGEFMGQPFRGVGFLGYDNVRQKYNSVWMDDLNTTMITSEGDADPEATIITLGGTYACAMTGEKHKACKQIYRILSRDQHVFEMHDPANRKNSKMLEVIYTRR